MGEGARPVAATRWIGRYHRGTRTYSFTHTQAHKSWERETVVFKEELENPPAKPTVQQGKGEREKEKEKEKEKETPQKRYMLEANC